MITDRKELSPESQGAAVPAIESYPILTGITMSAEKGSRNRGFAGMNEAKKRDIASMGGKAAHVKGTAHKFTPEEAREAGRKGGEARSRRINQEKEKKANSGETL